MPLTDSEKAGRARQRMLASARKYTTGTYKTKHVAPVFQRMIRAEAGVGVRQVLAVCGSELRWVSKPQGYCVCVTCGNVREWSGGGSTRLGGMHTGHYLPGRSNAIIFEESNVAPQCAGCNVFNYGKHHHFRLWMEEARGLEVIQRLHKLSNTTVQFTIEELVDRKIEYASRLRVAVERMGE